MDFLSKKPLLSVVIAFVLGLLVMGCIWSFSLSSGFSNPNSQAQERLSLQQQAKADYLKRIGNKSTGSTSGAMQQRYVLRDVAKNMLKLPSIEKIQLSGLTLKFTMKGGAIFSTQQPKKDAYLPIIKDSKAQIQVIK